MTTINPRESAPIISEQTLGGSLTEEQYRYYVDEGYLIMRGLLEDEDIAPARKAMQQKVQWIAETLYNDGMISDTHDDAPFESRLARLFDNLTAEDFLRFGRGWRDRIPGYYKLMANPSILDVIESLIGPEIFSNPVYNVRPKVPRVAFGAVPWHQDKSYWPDANSNPVITAWVPLVRADDVNGCLHIWPRTHRSKVLSWGRDQYTGTGYTELDYQHLEGAKREAVPLHVDPGDVIFFNDRCIHMSTTNNSENVRWSCDLRYQPTDQDPMRGHGVGFLARSHQHPERLATLDDWLAERPEHKPDVAEQGE